MIRDAGKVISIVVFGCVALFGVTKQPQLPTHLLICDGCCKVAHNETYHELSHGQKLCGVCLELEFQRQRELSERLRRHGVAQGGGQ